MRVARNQAANPAEPLSTRKDVDDLIDAEVPAAVVCAQCGDADCPGCLHENTRSGVISIVAWERPGAPLLGRLWATARATTFDAERFFETLPDGPLGPALRFAILSEILASSAMAVALLLPIGLLAPAWARDVLLHQRLTALRLTSAIVAILAALLVVAHAAHGWALDRGARRSGARPATMRALRFGLYAAGWDLVVGPLGAVVVAVKEGVGAALSIAALGVGLPGRSARAFLRGCYRLEGKATDPAMRASWVAAAAATAVGAVIVIAALVVVVFG
jgi:hypothetical protein